MSKTNEQKQPHKLKYTSLKPENLRFNASSNKDAKMYFLQYEHKNTTKNFRLQIPETSLQWKL